LLASCSRISNTASDFVNYLSPSDSEVMIELPPAAQPVYESGDSYIFEVNGTQVVETVTEVAGDVVHWGDDSGVTWATLHDPILQPISEIEISRRYSQAALEVFPLQKSRKITFTVFEMPRDGSERRRVETCEVLGAARVAVKAGEFDTFKVHCKRRDFNETLFYSPLVGHTVKTIREGSVTNQVSQLVTFRKRADVEREKATMAQNKAEMAEQRKMRIEQDERVMAAKKREDAAYKEEEAGFKAEAKGEKVEDKNFAQMQKELKEDEARAADSSQQNAGISRLFFDEEMLKINERIHTVSERVEEISERVHSLAELFERVPSRLAALEAGSGAPAPSAPAVITPTAPKEPVMASGAPFWGVQLGAYKTRSGAEKAWARVLTNPAAIELNDATVQYILTKPRKDGSRLTRIVVNQFAKRSTAKNACKVLKGKGVDCVAVHIKP
jgi:hypothetical protein